ncbi:MAG TPA: cytochrome c oxidase assembly protein [Actinomycetota bacterium]|nr:cytochrome c oxidase assembly protein [Actinomycetota bacterium]
MGAWLPDPGPAIAVLAASWAYARGLRAVRPPRWRGRAAAFWAGLAVTAMALVSPLDAYADRLFSLHMLQHFLLSMVAPPLLLAGAPITLLARAAGRRGARMPVASLRPVAHPFVGWTSFVGGQYVIHFTPLFEASLRSEPVHALLHGLALGTGLLFWWPVVGLDPGSRRLSFPARLLYLALAIPAMGFVGLAIVSARAPLYPAYAELPPPWGPRAAPDQDLGGTLMWVLGDLTLLVAILVTAARWRTDELRGEAAARRSPAGPPSGAGG